MSLMRHDGPIYLSKYEHDNDLIYKPIWKQLCRYVKNTKKMNWLLKAVKAKRQKNTVTIKFWVKIPRDYKEAIMFYSDH